MQNSSGKVSRRMSALHKMVDAAASGTDGVKWNHVLHYLRANCQVNDDGDEANHPSSDEGTRNRSNVSRKKKLKRRSNHHEVILEENPLPSYYVATDDLKQELWLDKSKGLSVLRSVLSSAPPKIIAALAFLLPETLVTSDTQNRLPIHFACRYPVSDRLDDVMKVIITASPVSLLHRDDDGRTPLHYLLWFHAEDRSPEIVDLFCQNLASVKAEFFKLRQPILQKLPNRSVCSALNKQDRRQQQQLLKEEQTLYPLPEIPKPSTSNKIPYTAAIIPDSAHGCIPLHYAAMEGASVAVLQVLLQAFPQSKHCIDRYGRTPLHWYLGAGTLDAWRFEGSVPQLVSGEVVQGELQQHEITKLSHDRIINQEVVKILLSSRVARTSDSQKRYPLHWAVSFLAHNFLLASNVGRTMSLQVIQLLLDNFVGQLICCDKHNMTPAMLLFDTVAKIQASERNKNVVVLDSFFDPPMELIEMLLKHPDPSANANVAAMEDQSGRLPLHAALEVAASPECIALLIKCHPTALIHTAEETLFVPLHSAFCHKHTAPIQTAEIVSLLLQAMQAGRYGTFMDGRLAMKMEDVAGFYPIHYAAQNGASLDVINALVERYPNTALLPAPNGDLPLHCLMSDELMQILTTDATAIESKSNEILQANGTLCQAKSDVLAVTREKMCTLLRPLLSDPSKLAVADRQYGMLPLHCAVLFEAADYPLLLRMLELYPKSASQFTNAQTPDSSVRLGASSPLDLHEMRKPHNMDGSDVWNRKRELLFSFSPTLESHRHREELLDQCVRIVIDELGETSLQDKIRSSYRYHLKIGQQIKSEGLTELGITHSVSDMEKAALQSFGFQQSRPPRQALNSDSASKIPSGSLRSRTKLSYASRRKSKGADSHHEPKIDTKRPSGRKKPTRKGGSSMYDDDNTSLDYDNFSEGYESESGSGEETDGPFSSDADYSRDDSEDDEDLSDRGSDGEPLSRDVSRSFGYTTSGSRLRTTFEGSAVSDDETRTDDDSGSFSATDDTGTRRTFDDDESTLISPQPTMESERKNAFDAMKESLAEEEKKEDYSFGGDGNSMVLTPRAFNGGRKQKLKPKPRKLVFEKPEYISEVAIRIWSFFVLYCDPNNPSDNYVKQVSDVIDEIKFSTVERIVSLPLPPYAQHYIDADAVEGMTFRDFASPKCRELIHKTCYFVGRYDLTLQQQQQQENNISVLVHRSADGSSVTIRALEWLFTTEEDTPARDAGVAVENIWATGEIPAEIGVTFRSQKRAVWIKFTSDARMYESEVSKRMELNVSVEEEDEPNESHSCSVGIVPLLSHYNAFGTDRKKDRTYNVDINDERFNVINLFAGEHASEQFKLLLQEYPYALVYPASTLGGTLYDYFFHYGLQSTNSAMSSFADENRSICASVAVAVAKMHEQGILHGDISMRNIVKYGKNSGATQNEWSILSMQMASSLSDDSLFLGGISSQGHPQFKTDTLPPEMFTKLSPAQLKAYNNYWSAVQEVFQVKINRAILQPMIDLNSGSSYVVKCHFVPLTDGKVVLSENQAVSIPPLPYDLVPVNKSADLWALGQMIFLVSTGRTLFHSDVRNGSLLEYASACHWNPNPVIYEHVLDPMAQDILLKLLSPRPERESIKMDQVLTHPFFVEKSASLSSRVKQITEKRRVECAAYKREQQRKLHEAFERDWLEKKTTTMTCWDFEVLEKIYLSPSEIVRRMTTRKERFPLPCNFILLPYKLSPHTPVSAAQRVQAESIGERLLQLSKACCFISVMKQATSHQDETASHRWSSSEMLRVLDLSSDDFADVQSEMADLAAKHVEAFRNDPMSVGLKLVQARIQNFFTCFDDQPIYMYLVDEFLCQPVFADMLPICVPDEWRESILRNGLLSTHLCALHARGVSGGIDGLANLIFNDSNHIIPPGWTEASGSLNHKLDEVSFVQELRLLQEALTDMFSTRHRLGDDDINVIHDFLTEVDPNLNLAGVQRVVVSGAWLWTSIEGAKTLEELSHTFSFHDALARSRRLDAKVKESKSPAETRSR